MNPESFSITGPLFQYGGLKPFRITMGVLLLLLQLCFFTNDMPK